MQGVVRVALIGLGPIGIEVGKALALRPTVLLLGAADPAPALAGRDMGEVLTNSPSGKAIAAAAADVYAMRATPSRADIAILCTGSRLPDVAPQIEEAIDAGFNVISTCEELAFPFLRHARIAVALERRAKAAGVTVLGTGVNPGMVMDRLPVVLASICTSVSRVRVERVVDVTTRRKRLQHKVGAGISATAFAERKAAGTIGHVGLGESAALVARGLRAPLDRVDETLEPVIGDDGSVLGIRQTAIAISDGNPIVELLLAMYAGAPDSHDRVVIDGDPPLDVTIAGGVAGDRATIGAVVNAVPAVLAASPGLRTVTQLPLAGLYPVWTPADMQ